MWIFGVVLNLLYDSFHSVVTWDFLNWFFTLELFSELFAGCSWSLDFWELEFMYTADLIKWFQLSCENELFYCHIWSVFFQTSDSDTENSFLLEKLQTFFEASCQVAFTTWCNGNIFESITSCSNCKWVDNDVIFDQDSGCFNVTVWRGIVFTVCQCQDS